MDNILNKLNSLVGREYDKDNFHCWHLIELVLPVPTLEDIAVDTVADDIAKYKDLFTEIETPENYCIILLGEIHIGIYYQDGAYHNDTGGVRWESLRNLKLRYKGVKYYDIL